MSPAMKPVTVPLFQVDAFTRMPFTGNPAGVVLDAEALSAEQMQCIAREIHVGDTAFVLPPDGADHDVLIRFFTPRSEAAFVGHATVAAHAVLLQRGRNAQRQKQRSGLVDVAATWHDGVANVSITQPAPLLRGPPAPEALGAALAALGLDAAALDPRAPPMLAGAASTRLLLAVRHAGLLAELQPDLRALAALSPRLGAPGYFLYAVTATGPQCQTQARMYCPALGIDEDPVSGNAHGMLAAWLWQCGLVTAPAAGGSPLLTGLQGQYLQRPGSVQITLNVAGAELLGVRIRGEAVIVFETTLSI
jgi:PhzF family phenazine biosynthesis protein